LNLKPPVNYGLEVRYTFRSFIRVLSLIAKDYEISAAEFRLLRTLSDGTHYTQVELANLTAMDRPYVASLVKRMISKGLLAARTSKQDRRRTDLALTAKGKKLGAALFNDLDVVNDSVVKGIGVAKLDTFVTVLRQIRSNLDAYEVNIASSENRSVPPEKGKRRTF
jgi:MarR family transcriptional regulator, organic hydroperoxide resistance regulator